MLTVYFNLQISGYRLIIDMDGLSMSQVIHFTPPFAAAVIEWLQKCCPGRFKSIEILNQPYIFNIVFAIFKPFIEVGIINKLLLLLFNCIQKNIYYCFVLLIAKIS